MTATENFSSLTPAQRRQFESEGYLAFENVLTEEEVTRARQALSDLVAALARDPAAVQKGTLLQRPGARLMVQFEKEYAAGRGADLDLAEVELKVRKLMSYHEDDPHLHFLATAQPGIQGIVAALLGPNPILFQDMALVKPPFIGSEKPWHQDNAYFSVTPLTAICGVWIALDDATVENGCMHVIPGGHRLGALRHHHDRDCEIVSGRIDPAQAVPVPLRAGGALFFLGMLPHQTPPNASPARRRALQFHYRSQSSRSVPREEYDRLYAEADGTPASCAAAR